MAFCGNLKIAVVKAKCGELLQSSFAHPINPLGYIGFFALEKTFPIYSYYSSCCRECPIPAESKCLQQSPSVLLQKDPDRLPNGRVSWDARLRDSALALMINCSEACPVG